LRDHQGVERTRGQAGNLIVNHRAVLAHAEAHLLALRGHVFDVLSIAPPVSTAAAVNLAKVISKLSPLLGNLIEFNTVEVLNASNDYDPSGQWERQDPGFPDAVFRGRLAPPPGFEIKAWFPCSTEITARFKDSQNHFKHDHVDVVMLAWMPESVIYGKPRILDVCVVSGLSVAKARDDHYHNPPDYLVVEPEDTSTRTRNLQQTNTNGYKWQGTARDLATAEKLVRSWGRDARRYQPTATYQARLRELIAKYPYRLDTNYAKMDRIAHGEIEAFKKRVLGTSVHGHTVLNWARLLAEGDDTALAALTKQLGVKEADAAELIE
jgi:hypothetical protein